MTIRPLPVLVAGTLLLVVPLVRADGLDDLIAAQRSGAITGIDPAKRKAILDETHQVAEAQFAGAVVDLYLWEVRSSIADPDGHGGWPFRSFLVYDTSLRGRLAKTLAQRFADHPDAMLAYALVCPMLFAGDEQTVAQCEGFLKENDAFLYQQEQANVNRFWRPSIKNVLKAQAPPAK